MRRRTAKLDLRPSSNGLIRTFPSAATWSIVRKRERLGYGGDAHATCETGMFNYKTAAFYTKWMEDWRDNQGSRIRSGQPP